MFSYHEYFQRHLNDAQTSSNVEFVSFLTPSVSKKQRFLENSNNSSVRLRLISNSQTILQSNHIISCFHLVEIKIFFLGFNASSFRNNYVHSRHYLHAARRSTPNKAKESQRYSINKLIIIRCS